MVLSNLTVSANTNLSPQAPRDVDVLTWVTIMMQLDYLVDQLSITNATLTITQGTTIACYNDTGFLITDGSSINSVGSPNVPNWITRYSSVQEQPVSLLGLYGSSPSSAFPVNPYHAINAPSGQFRFTKFTCPAGGGTHLYHGQSNWAYSNLLVQDCEFWNGTSDFRGYNSTTANLNNNLFVRSIVSSERPHIGSQVYTNDCLSLSNNLIWNAAFTFRPNNANSNLWLAFNNDFDNCTFGINTPCVNGYNAYINCNKQLNPTNANNVVTTKRFGVPVRSSGGLLPTDE